MNPIHCLSIFSCLLHTGCMVAYAEYDAQRKGQTGDPNSGGAFGYSQAMADANTSIMKQELKSAEAQRSATHAEISNQKSRLAALQSKRSSSTDAAVSKALDDEINLTRKRITTLNKQ